MGMGDPGTTYALNANCFSRESRIRGAEGCIQIVFGEQLKRGHVLMEGGVLRNELTGVLALWEWRFFSASAGLPVGIHFLKRGARFHVKGTGVEKGSDRNALSSGGENYR